MENQQDEFELIPMSPIRRLEKRIEKVESGSGVDTREFLREIIDIIRMNQQIVDELAKANDALRIELSRLPGRIEELITNLNELLSFVKASATEEAAPSISLQPLAEKFDKLIEENQKIVNHNESILSALEDIGRKLRPVAPLQPLKKSLPFSPKPIAR
jgi:chromosome segregation ATPase